jgi:uncharacterized protein (TIGR02453 family)
VSSGFVGWTGDFQGYFIGLQLDNSKSYFDRHRRRYQQEIRGPMEALLHHLEPEFGPGKIFRPNRDVRFSADKSPYKTNIAADVGMGRAGGYVSLDAKGLMAAAGRYLLDPAQLPKLRAAVADDRSGEELARIVAELESAGYEIGGEDLKRVPGGLPQDHPRARLLKHKRLYFWRSFGCEPWLATPEAAERVAQVFRDGRPLGDWFARHVDQPGGGPSVELDAVPR